MTRTVRTQVRSIVAAVCVLSALVASPAAHAWLGALAKLGSAGGKAATVGKGAAAGGAAVAGAEMATGANAAAKVGAHSADELSKASGLGKAVPDDIAGMLSTPGKALADVPDTGARAWLATPPSRLKPGDADLMVTDYVKLLQGKPANGPANRQAAAGETASKKPSETPISGQTPASQIPWHAIELLARAAHLGHRSAQSELNRVCQGADKSAQRAPQCPTPASTTAIARKP